MYNKLKIIHYYLGSIGRTDGNNANELIFYS